MRAPLVVPVINTYFASVLFLAATLAFALNELRGWTWFIGARDEALVLCSPRARGGWCVWADSGRGSPLRRGCCTTVVDPFPIVSVASWAVRSRGPSASVQARGAALWTSTFSAGWAAFGRCVGASRVLPRAFGGAVARSLS